MNKTDKMIDAINHFDIAKIKKYIETGDIYRIMAEQPYSFFNLVVNSNCIDKVKFLMDLGADPNVADEKGMSPLFMAAISNENLEMIELLLDYGAKYNTDFEEITLLEYLVVKNKYEISEFIVDKAIKEFYETDGELEELLFQLGVETKDTYDFVVDRIEIYIKEIEQRLEEIKNEARMPAMYIHEDGIQPESSVFIEECKTSSVDTIAKLLKNGEDIDQTDGYGYTGLMWAIEKENYEVARYLIGEGADVNIKSNSKGGNSALYDAIFAENINMEVIELLIENGADVNCANELNENCLQAAVISGSLEIVDLLIEHDVDVNFMVSKDEVGIWTYLNFEKDTYLDIMEALINAGLDINKQDSIGYTAVLEMASKGHLDVLEVLVENGADVNLSKNDGTTPLMMASFEDNEDIVRFLIKKGANLDVVNVNGYSALMSGAINGSYSSVKILLKNGADISIENDEGQTAIEIAEENNYNEIVKLISKYI